MARAVIGMAIELASSGLAPAMHDISEGGAALCAAELAIASSVGLTLQFTKWEGLFAENPNRFLAAVAPQDVAAVEALAVKYRVPVSQLGLFGGDHITYTNGGPETASLSLERATHTYEKAIPRRME